ncbi:protein panoramix [Drosophila ficusphila]|uniref:protein panoramix n=1 Tax=Drosophila ficusphila TaxID=30025 RepID=UPI0007E8A3DA|nr:protein panoramix [Drosophila ficusphila]
MDPMEVMDLPIKEEIKVEEDAINEDDATPLRESTGESPPHAFMPAFRMSGSGWDSDPEDNGQRSTPPTPGSHLKDNLEAVEPKGKIKEEDEPVEHMLDGLLEEELFERPVIADVKPNVKLEVVDQGRPNRDGLPSDFTSRDSMNDMDLCSLEATKELKLNGPQTRMDCDKPEEELESTDSFDDLERHKMELLKKLAEADGKENDREKKKKKKHKKDRSHRSKRRRSDSSQDETPKDKRRVDRDSSQDETPEEKRRVDRDHRGRRHRVKTEIPDEELDYVPVRADEKPFLTINPSKLYERPRPKPEPSAANLSKADKRNLGVARAELVLELFQKKANKEEEVECHMVDTVCKLSVSKNFRDQGCFENPSPICNNMNVIYEFNSTPGTKIDLARWGLEVVPQATRELLCLLGIDVARLKEIQSSTKPSHRILKLKMEQMEQGLAPVEEVSGTLYKNAGTQTERRTASHDAGTQVRMDNKLKGAFWQDPDFNQINLTHQQLNVMFALQELSRKVPNSTIAINLYKALEPVLAIKRAASRH